MCHSVRGDRVARFVADRDVIAMRIVRVVVVVFVGTFLHRHELAGFG